MGDTVYHVPYTKDQIEASVGKGPIIQKVGDDGYWALWDIEAMRYVLTDVPALIGNLDEISAEATKAAQSANEAKTSAEGAAQSAEKAETVQAAITMNRRVIVGPASMINELGTGEVLFITDGGNAVEEAITLHDLLNMIEDEVKRTLTVGVAKALNLRRNEEGAYYTEETLPELVEKLAALRRDAIHVGYLDDATGDVTVTWAQAQVYILTGNLMPPLAAETYGLQWSGGTGNRFAALDARMDALEGSLEDVRKLLEMLVKGADKQ